MKNTWIIIPAENRTLTERTLEGLAADEAGLILGTAIVCDSLEKAKELAAMRARVMDASKRYLIFQYVGEIIMEANWKPVADPPQASRDCGLYAPGTK